MRTLLEPSYTKSRFGTTNASISNVTAIPSRSAYLACLYESRGPAPEIGLCLFDVTGPGKYIIAQLTDTVNYLKTFNKLSIYEPTKILVADSCLQDHAKSKLVLALEDNVEGAELIPVPRGWFNEGDGFEYCRKMSIPEEVNATLLVLEPKFYALCALSALSNYLTSSYRIFFKPGSLRIQYDSPEGSMAIDAETTQNLEVVGSKTHQKAGSLFHILNKCRTIMASRLLRINLLQPITDSALLQRRLDSVQELSGNSDAMQAIDRALRGLQSCDVERLIGLIVVQTTDQDPKKCENRILAMLALRRYFRSLEEVSAALLPCTSLLLRRIAELCNSTQLDSMQAHIEDVLQDINAATNAHVSRAATLTAIKPHCNALLDVARESYAEIVNDMTDFVKALCARHGFHMDLVNRNGFLLSARSASSPSPFPGVFCNKTTKGDRHYFTCLELKKRDQRARDAMSEILLISDRVLETLCDEVREDIAALHKTSEAIALLDLLYTLAQIASEHHYCRPEYAETIALYRARHPVLERSNAMRGYEPNNTFADPATNFQLITGANMAGKTTYLRQIALNIIMAQIGSFIPAEFGSLHISDSLLSRLGCDDQSESNLSNFAVEMRSMSFILSSATPKSVVFVDELGRATSTIDGVAISLAIAERLLALGCTVFFVTHLKHLKAALLHYPGTISLQVSPPHKNDQTHDAPRPHCVHEDTGEDTNNAIEIAQLAGFPQEVLEDARQYTAQLASRNSSDGQDQFTSLLARRKLLVELQRDLINIVEDGHHHEVLVRLRKIQKTFISRMLSGARLRA